ncbi:MAG: metal-dependent hydrolase family protein [Dehalococcoidia bacterium]
MLVFEHARLLDCTDADPRAEMTVVVEGERISRIAPGGSLALAPGATMIDCQGRTLMPGLIDAHVHLAAIELGLSGDDDLPHPVVALRVAAEIEATLQAGFTTVRDAGGLPWGYKEAVRLGLIDGPELLISGSVISQTGGHGDHRRRTDFSAAHNENQVQARSFIVDGPRQVRWATRENLRRGSDQIKVMANGGAMSPNDEMTSTQFTVEELAAAVQEAKAAGTYVLAHTYTNASMRNCIEAGVRSLEHGNFLDEPTALLLKQHGTYLVPTIVTYEQIAERGPAAGVGEKQLAKIRQGLAGAFEALEIAQRVGVKIASGSDLLGPMQPMKGREPLLKARVLGAMSAIVATTRTNAELLRLQDAVGTVEEGKFADLIVVDGDPTTDIALLADPARIPLIVKRGRVRKDIFREVQPE